MTKKFISNFPTQNPVGITSDCIIAVSIDQEEGQKPGKTKGSYCTYNFFIVSGEIYWIQKGSQSQKSRLHRTSRKKGKNGVNLP